MAAEKIDIFVPLEQEADYCNKHGIILTRYPNGAILLQHHKEEPNKVSSSLALRYQSVGSFYDPKSLSGLYHFYEHLASAPPLKTAMKYDEGTGFNADTGIYGMNIYIAGTANEHYRDFGVWPVIDAVRTMLYDPLGYTDDLDDLVSRERGTIIGEIREKEAEYIHWVDRHLLENIYSPDNPIRVKTLGNETALGRINPEDLIKLTPSLYQPERLVMNIYTEGQETASVALFNEFKEYLTADRRIQTPPLFDKSRFDRISTDLQRDDIYLKDLNLANRLVVLDFVWILEEARHSVEQFSSEKIIPLINNSVFGFSRGMGLGYSASAFAMSSGEQTKSVVVRLKFGSTQGLERLVEGRLIPGVRQSISRLKGENLKFRAEQIALKQQAVPLHEDDRVVMALNGLLDDGRVINGDAVKEVKGSVSESDMNRVLDLIIDQPPAIFLSGDLQLT